MESRGAKSWEVTRFLRNKQKPFIKLNSMADPSTVFEQTKVTILGGDPTDSIMCQLAFARSYREKCLKEQKRASILDNFDFNRSPLKVKHDLYCMVQAPVSGCHDYTTYLSPG